MSAWFLDSELSTCLSTAQKHNRQNFEHNRLGPSEMLTAAYLLFSVA